LQVCRCELVKSRVWLRVVGRVLLGMVMVWCPFFRVLGRGGGRFLADGWAGAGAVVTRVVAEGIFNVPGEVLLADDFAVVQADGVEGEMRIAWGVDPAVVGIVEEDVVPAAEDEGGFLPAIGKRERAGGGNLDLKVGLGFRGGLGIFDQGFWILSDLSPGFFNRTTETVVPTRAP